MARQKNYEKMLENWPYEYCRMTDAIERRTLLELAIQREIDPKGNEVRMLLWNRRHPKGLSQFVKGKTIVDEFMKAWMTLDIISGDVHSWFGKKKVLKETRKQLNILWLEDFKVYGELGEKILFEELYQLTYLYMTLCQDDRNYGTVVLGVGRLKAEDYANKVAQNIYRVCHLLPKALDMQEDFAIFQKAAREAYYDMFPRYEAIYDMVMETQC